LWAALSKLATRAGSSCGGLLAWPQLGPIKALLMGGLLMKKGKKACMMGHLEHFLAKRANAPIGSHIPKWGQNAWPCGVHHCVRL